MTATTHNNDGGQTEQDLYKKFGFKLIDLFPLVPFPKAELLEKNYMKLWLKLATAPYAGFAKLVLGKVEDIQDLVKFDFENFIWLDKENGINPYLETSGFYYVKSLGLAWSTDFRPV